MKLTLISIEKNGLIKVGCEGKVTAEDFPADGPNPFETILGANWATNKVLLDFSKTPYVDSSAVGWLVGANKQFKAAGGSLVIFSIAPSIKRLFDLLRLGKIVTLAEGEVAARALLEKEMVS